MGAGLAIVILAIVIDRITQGFGMDGRIRRGLTGQKLKVSAGAGIPKMASQPLLSQKAPNPDEAQA